MTKTELCEIVVSNHLDKNRTVKNCKIIQSSTLAVAMEYLSLIEHEEMKQYAATRVGILFSGFAGKKYKFFSFRKLLSLLPD